MRRFKKVLAFMLAAVILTVSGTSAVFAAVNENTEEIVIFKKLQRYLNDNARYDEVNHQTLAEGALFKILEENPELLDLALSGMLESIDEYSEYFTEEEFQEFINVIDPSFGGIGVVAQKTEDGIKIMNVFEGGQAEKAGIKIGDILISVDDMQADENNFNAVMDAVKGEIGTTVRIGIKRGEQTLTFNIVRAKVEEQKAFHEILDIDGKKILYIELTQFTENTASEVEQALKNGEAEGVKNVILDLRDNPGGVLTDVVKIAGFFVPKGSIVLKTDYKIPLFNSEEKTTTEPYDVKLAVLVNENSASGAEALAAAISQNESGTVIGTKTFGKGTVQMTRGFTGGGAIKYTEAYYLTPNGDNINKVGFTPDVVVENEYIPVNFNEFGELKGGRIYSVGDTGEDIKFIKNVFKRMGIFDGEINDVFDADLEMLITDFQQAFDLYPYGVIDFTTQYKLREYMNECQEVIDNQFDAAVNMF